MITIHCGDCRDILRTLPEKSVHCCVTSPPYYGLRDYGHPGQIGLEQTPDEYVAQMVAVFREVKRVLRDDGTLWLNLGDSYAHSTIAKRGKFCPDGYKMKDILGIPWLIAFALRADGWYLRQDIIWHKPNPMPESVTDRCTKAHEYIFLLSKSQKYFYDAEAVKEKSTGNTRGAAASFKRNGSKRGISICPNSPMPTHREDRELVAYDGELRNRRSVWTVATKPFRGAHFAVFPPELPEVCIKAGCPDGGTVLDPFAGSGTTGEVATYLGRNAILIELNPEYIALCEGRGGLFCEVAT